MASNRFGNLFCITTWGESHGRAIGVVIDGCPAGLEISEEAINAELAARRPGHSPYTSPRKEEDHAEIYSGILDGKTTGTPLSIIIFNRDAQSNASVKGVLQPGHAHFTYLQKYGLFDERGSGRASARETACRVAAGAVAKALLRTAGIEVLAFIQEMGGIAIEDSPLEILRSNVQSSPLFCPDSTKTSEMIQLLEKVRAEGDSLGGIVELRVTGIPAGLGDPIYEKLEANLAKAMLSINASKGFEIGSGFEAARMRGSSHNDLFALEEGRVVTRTNHAGGVLAGISTGMPLVARVAFKPPSSIRQPQATLTREGQPTQLELSKEARHDPCVAIRAVPVVEAMTALVLADAWLMTRSSKLAE